MRQPIWMERDGSRLRPCTVQDEELLREYPVKTSLEVRVKLNRNWRQLQAFWATMHGVIEATGSHPTADYLVKDIKLGCGYVTRWQRHNGEIVTEPDSIALERMSQDVFNRFFRDAEKWIAENLGVDIGGWDESNHQLIF